MMMATISAISASSRLPPSLPIPNHHHHHFLLLPNNRLPSPPLHKIPNPKSPKNLKFAALASADGQASPDGGGRRRPYAPAKKNVRWRDLLDPDPENIAAVGLAGLLTWAGVSVLCQLFFISFAILLAALKYSFVAALLLFILIALL